VQAPGLSRGAVVVILLFAALFGAASGASAQSKNYGAPFLLLPLGAQAVGQGEAAVADTSIGTESLWWNAAGLGRLRKHEIAVHHSQTAAAQSDMLTLAIPSKILGTIAGAAYIVNLGDIEATGNNGEPLGTSTNRFYMLAASYATPVGKRLSAGITAKLVMLRFLCSGCAVDIPQLEGTTSAFDLGAQYVTPSKLPVTLGVSIRNLGAALQVNDEQQADPLPRIVQAGAHVTLPVKALEKNGASLDAMSDVFISPAYEHPAISLGLNLTLRQDIILRGGYRSSSGNEGNTGGLSAGIGLRKGGIALDLARKFDSASSELGQPPTYVSLRFAF
jgi:hypothetical protein